MSFSINNADILDDKALIERQKELKIYLKCMENCETAQLILGQHTLLMLNPDDAEIKDWYKSPTTGQAIVNFMMDKRNHNKWNNGIFGSRWINTILEGKDIRLCFYSKKNDPKMWENMPVYHQPNKFMLVLALN